MKRFMLFVCFIAFLCAFTYEAEAQTVKNMGDDILEALPEEVLRFFEDAGIGEDFYDELGQITPSAALETVLGIFKGEMREPLKTAASCLVLMMTASLFVSFLPSSETVSTVGKHIALLCVMFLLVSASADIFNECASSLLLTEDFMLTLIPVFGGIVAFGGNPSLALSFNTVAFAFAEAVSGFFNGAFPLLCIVMLAVASAAAINPVISLDGVTETLAKCVNVVMAFVSGIFVAVMSVRGVIAGAADTVTIRGFRFLVGNAVPVVGSAIGEALNSVAAGLGLAKNTIGMLGIASVAVINLPVLVRVALWKGILYFLMLSADILGINEIKSFVKNLNAVMSVITGAVCFVSFVFIISVAILITVSRG